MVSAVSKPADAILWPDVSKGDRRRVEPFSVRARFELPEEVLDLGTTDFGGRQVWRVGWPPPAVGTRRTDRGPARAAGAAPRRVVDRPFFRVTSRRCKVRPTVRARTSTPWPWANVKGRPITSIPRQGDCWNESAIGKREESGRGIGGTVGGGR